MASRTALRSLRKRKTNPSQTMQRRLSHQTLEKRELLASDFGPQLISVAANSGENFRLSQQNILREAPTQLTFRFDGSQQIDPSTLNAITIERAGGDGSFEEGNEVRIVPGFLGFGDSPRIVIARFAETLPDDTYRITIAGYDDTNAGVVGLRNTEGELFRPLSPQNPSAPDQQIRFRLELGPQVVAVVPQPITGFGATRIQQRNQIHVYFNDDPLSNPALGVITNPPTPGGALNTTMPSVVQPRFYNLFLTGDTVENTDDVKINPISVQYDPSLNRAVLTFASDLSDFAPAGAGTFRLRIGSSQALPGAPTVLDLGGAGDTFQTAHDLAVNFNATPQSIVIRGEIEPSQDYPVLWPGIDSPGTRDHRRDPQVFGQPDSTPGINVYYYNFADAYGLDPFDNVLDNAITPAQKQRTREILALYAQHLGVQFIETENRGLQIVTGDLRALVRPAITGPGEPLHEFRLNDEDPTQGVLILDSGENWYDGYGLSPDANRPSWFVEALRGIGSLLGIGHTFEQVPGVASGSNPALYNAGMFPLPNGTLPANFAIEPDFLSTSDIIPGQALHRPEIRDVDLYRFNVAADGRIAIETFAQRLDNTSTLDTDIKLWKLNAVTGQYDLVSRNDDYYSNDSFIGLDVSPNADGSPAQYVVGITASGNEDYNPNIAGSGMGGRSQGHYELRITFQNRNVDTIKDANGSALDGNGNGTPGGDFNFWFRTAAERQTGARPANDVPRTLFVDKAGVNATTGGSAQAPFRTISYAFAQARPGDIVRILPSTGADGQVGTTGDNLAYEIGRGGPTNAILSDGETFNVPRGVTVMIDAGTIMKLRGAKISVGSERIDEDRSLAALQVLGVPILVDANGTRVSGEVIFTSYQDESLGVDTNPLPTTPAPGQWAGIEFRNDFDYSEGRPVWETEGIFIDYVSHADIRYGGGSIAPTQPIVTPLQMLEARPMLIHNTIRFSSDAAISADPNSFAETNFHAPLYQRASAFTSDYDRVGPDIRGNRLVDNSINGLFVRVRTPAAGQREPMTVSGRFDDFDITHVISEVLVLQGQPGGPVMLERRPDVLSTQVNPPTAPLPPVGTLTTGQTIDYRVTFVTVDGVESLASLPTRDVTVGANRNVRLTNLPQAPEGFAGRRLYRLDPNTGDYVFVTQLDRNTTSYLDTGRTRGGVLSEIALAETTGERLLPRFDARLSIDPGLVIKLDSARIEAGIGADFYAEGIDGKPIVFTSRLDDQYGAGGTFDTNNDGSLGVPQPGSWSGLVFRQGSTASLDHTIIRYAGGSSSVSGGFARFNPVEILQADVRIANSTFMQNASGNAGNLDFRDGIGFNGSATIFVRGAQPVIVDNIIRDNLGAAISVNPDALNYLEIQDRGRSTGNIDRFAGGRDNQGPLIAGNSLDNNAINGLLVRNEALTTESVWDDTDIVHVVERFVYAWNHHHRSGLRLKSHADQSLVVKLQNGGALVADRYLNDIEDAIGGTIQVIGQPGFPVVLTSIHDDTVGAGYTPGGLPQNNTDNANVTPRPGDWYGIVLRAGVNDRNVAFILESEPAVPAAAGMNAIPATAQIIGSLATGEQNSDENRRLGFNVRGTLSQNSDIDVYSFSANGQTEVFIDIDDTSFGLDTIVELIDVNGNILALSQSSHDEAILPNLLVNNIGPGAVLPLFKTGQRTVEGPNTLDAGMRVILPGNSNTVNQYYVRVRSSNLAPGDSPSKLTNPSAIGQGRSSGQYQLSIRLRETDEIAGSTVRLADIRFATNAIDVPATPFNSPLAAEFAERLQVNGLDVDGQGSFTNAGAQPLGSLNDSHSRVLRVSGFLGNNVANPASPMAGQDIDVYRVDLFDDRRVPDIIGQNRFVSAIFDIDYADQLARANTRLSIFDAQGRLILHGLNSNVADDQGRPRFGNDMGNLGAGSAGTLDSYIGPVELQEGTYYVVVSSAQMTPQVLDQYFNANATDTNIRMLPVDSVRRIAEEGFSDRSIVVNGTPQRAVVNQQLNTTADRPTVVPLFDETSIVPYTLEDVRMFLTLQGGLSGNNQTTVVAIDPFTGQLERTIGQFGQPVADVGMRRDGELFAYSLGPASGGANAGNAGNYLNISTVNGASSNVGDDGLTFQRNNQNGDNTENDPNAVFRINAMAFVPQSASAGASFGNVPSIGDGERVFVVGDRNNSGRGGEVPLELRQNVVYSMVATSGAATNQGSTDGNQDRNFGAATTPFIEPYGPGSNKQEFGIIDVGQFRDSDPRKTGGSITGLAQNQGLPAFGGSIMFGVTDTGALYSFNPSDRRTVDVSDFVGGTYSRVINTTFHGTVARDPEHSSFFNEPPEFSSLTLGPRATEGGRYNNVFFATTTDGWLYTFQISPAGVVEPAPVLIHGRSALPIITALGSSGTGFRQITGVAFSIREENPWHQTSDRNTPFALDGPNSQNNQHGVFQPHNQSRIRTSGGSSLYFGFEPTANVADNTLNNDGATGNLAPGGLHGTTVSRPFSLEGYASADKPTLYFNYFLEVQADADFTPTRQQLDSFRVFAAGDDGQWRLLATNNSFRSFSNQLAGDEYDYFATNGGIPVQELHANTDVWRQARVDLSPLAGNKNVQLRFDFSTAGGMQSQFRLQGYLTEIQAVPGTEVVNGSTFSLSEQLVTSNRPASTFEFVRGAAINIPTGTALLNGQQLTFNRPQGAPITVTLRELGTPGSSPNRIDFQRGESAQVIAQRIADRLNLLDPSLMASAQGGQLLVPEASSFTLNPPHFRHADILVPSDPADPLRVDPAIVGRPLTVVSELGVPTTVTPQTQQRISFTSGGQTVTVTANNPGSANDVRIVFNGDAFLGDTPAFATFSAANRQITVNYNSQAATLTNRDFNAIVTAINNLAAFSATLTSGNGALPFVPPAGTPQFPNNEVYFNTNESAAVVASRIVTRLNALDSRLSATVSGARVIVRGAAGQNVDPVYQIQSFNAGITDSQLLPNGNVPIFYTHAMTDVQVRDAIRSALAMGLGVQNPDTGITQATAGNFPGYGTNRIRIFEQALAANNSAVGFSTFLPGDEFGSAASTSVTTTGVLARNAASNNNVEGVYIDDIVIGFASRGEVVLNAPADNRNFTIDPTYRAVLRNDLDQPEFPDEILVGGYTLEVRGAPTYGVPHDYSPIRLGLNEQFSWGRSFDVNDRLNPGAVTLNAPSGRELTDGETFVISNGTRSVTFEFDSNGSVAQGHVRVPFVPVIPGAAFNHLTDSPAEVARAIRDAINSPQARNVLGITAAGGDSSEVGPMSGNRVELFGDVIHVNPSAGRFLLVDLVAQETPYGRESYRAFPRVDHENETVENVFMLNSFTRATATQYLNNATQFVVSEVLSKPNLARHTVTQYADGTKDTLVAKGKIGDTVVTGLGNERIISDPLRDVDVVKIYLNAGDTIDALVETNRFNRGAPFRTPRVQIFADDADQTELADSLTFDPTDFSDPSNPFATTPFTELAIEATINGFTAPQSGYYFVAVSTIVQLFIDPANPLSTFNSEEWIGQYQLTVRPSGTVASEPLAVEYHLERGDTNIFRGQGQLVIESNFISDFAETGVRATYAGDNIPGRSTQSPLQLRPGGAAMLRNQNTERLLPGTVIMNNVITASQGTGILFEGDTPVGGQAPPPVPFGRIVNNTVVAPSDVREDTSINVEFLPIDPATIMAPNDDGSSTAQNFGFDFRFFGNTYTQFWVNNNGNLTFTGPLGQFTASGFPTPRAIIAPFWADVDTRLRPGGGSAGTVHLTRGTSVRGNPVIQIDWVDVGYFTTTSPANTGATNTFTVYLESHPAGDIVAFRYGDMAWTTGDASGGTNGFGGTGAQIGFDSGDGTNFISLGRPRSQAELDAVLAEAPFIFQIDPVTGIPGGGRSDASGIVVRNSASPTVLNNVISGFEIGLEVGAASASTVENGNAFHNNTTASTRPLGPQSFEISPNTRLFEDPSRRIFIPAAGTSIIDSSFASLNDRATFFNTVKQPVGIGASPIIAPVFDAYGIPRVDDPLVTTPGGVGSNVFIDRGAIDRADFRQPTAVLVNPIDFIAGQGVQVPGGDIDPDSSFVHLPANSPPVSFFEIQLLDPAGTGPDAATITSETVILTENGITLTPGVDYTFGYSDNSRVIRLTPLAGLWRPDAVYEVTLNNRGRVSLTLPSGSEITDGDRYVISDSQNRQSVFEFDSGHVLQVPHTLGLEVLGPNTFFRDGDVFNITAPDGTSRNFEINLIGAVASGHIPINIASAGTVQEIRNVILAAISASGVAGPLDLAPRALGNDSLQIGSLQGHQISGNVEGLRFFGTAAGVTAGDQFRYTTPTADVLFEFTDGSAPSDPDAVAIPIDRTDTADEIAAAIAQVVRNEQLGLAAARSIGDGRVLLGGTAADVVNVSDSALTQIGRAGVTGSLRLTVPQNATAASLENRTFSVRNGNVTVNFIFTTNPSLATPSRRIVLAPSATPDQIAAAIAAEITAGFSGALSPTAQGRVVTLNEQAATIPSGTPQVRADVDTGTTPLVLSGVSGGAIAVPFIPTSLFTPAAAAATLTTAIASSPLVVTTFAPGGGTLLFGGTSSIDLRRADGSVVAAGQPLPAITDLAGNRVESNRDNDETRFTIIMPEVRFDFGDAPDSYGTTLANNGARHSVSSSATPRLGRVIDTEPDGQPFPASDDSVVPVTATSPGNSPLFSFSSLEFGGSQITISPTATPRSGDRVRISIGPDTATFELVARGVAPLTGNIPVPLLADDTAETIAARLAAAIRSELAPSGRAVVVEVPESAPNVIRVETLDDEDGVAVGIFSDGNVQYTVFLRPEAFERLAATTPPGQYPVTSDPNDVLGFLNPFDPAGTNIAVTVTGSGLLDVWIDFDGDGIFDPTREQVLTNVPVVDGVNILNIVTPPGTPDGMTWARFRLSTGGNLRPTGVAIGGEVEDYQVQIIGIPLPTPQDDEFTINEDTILDTTTDLSQPSLIDNDTIPPETFIPVQFFVGEQPQHGTLTILDHSSGRFIYEPFADFSGVDTFTYRLSTQANAGAVDANAITFATVTINVRPVNDPPIAMNQGFLTLENQPTTITAAQLLADARAHANPQFPVGNPGAPWDESNQSLRVVSLQAGNTTINASNATDTNGNPRSFATPRGSVRASFNGNGSLIEVIYTPGQDLNRDNVLPVGSGPVLDTFLFTIEDDGVLIDPVTGNPIQGTPLRATATASIDVAPRNNPPTLVTDQVSVGIVGVTNTNTAWRQYFVSRGLPVPVPTEDTPLVIPAAFLLQNDLSGSPLSHDENNFVAGNDGPLQIISVSINHGNATVEIDDDGNIVFTPPDDIYGNVIFTYVAIDQGINEELDGTRNSNPLTSTGTVTVTLQPVNDPPVAFDRALTFTESPNPGSGPAFVFTRQQLIQGAPGETPAVPGAFDPALGAPFNESEQFLNVVQFTTAAGTVDVTDLTGVGTEVLTLASDAGGVFQFEFINGIFNVGRFTSAPDYNQRTPFAPLEQFTFVIEDDGRTTRPQGSGVVTLPRERSIMPATVSITVLPSNDAPQFDFLPIVDVLERDDRQGTVVPGFAFNILPGPPTAEDELERQNVSFTILAAQSTVPAGLMEQPPTVDANGTLTVFPSPDAVGTAIYVVRATDAEPGTDGFVPRSTLATFTVNVRPVNDPPRINQAIAGTGQTLNPDEAWSVSSTGVITYTLKEDNTQALGVTQPYIIDMRRALPLPNYARIGLLDVFTVGPPNEADGTLGGNQVLRLFSFDATTALGGTIEAIGFDANGNITQLQYTPPRDYNSNLGGPDSFTYVVQDNNPFGGETWDLESGALREDRQTATGRVEFVMRPVNDPPQFDLSVTEVSVLEDSGSSAFEDFAINIFAGPPNTAFDEIDPVSGQRVSFSVAALSPGAGQLFAVAPTVRDDGTLVFTPAPDAFGSAVFEIRATDDGPDNATRGDIVSSAAQTFTINIRPVNDRPVLNTTTPVSFTLNEDAAVLQSDGTVAFQGTFIPLRGTGGVLGLLDVFNVGPPNEAADITPGGNQSIRITTPIPASTSQGGTLSRVFDPLDPTVLIGLRYVPRANFNGIDTFIYGVIDDGVSQDLDGNVFSDPREAFNTVRLNVLPLNDPPQFSGPLSVTVNEDATTTETVGLSIIPNFVTDIAPGPPGALDELGQIPGIPAQTVSFVVTPVAGNPANLFSMPPTVSPDGTLTFRTVQDANGVAVFTIMAIDSGPHNPPLEVNRTAPRTFTITVNPVNDPPTFVPALTQIVVAEDSGPFTTTEPFATEISPGPPDEVAAGQTVRFEVTTPQSGRALFQALPSVTDNGFFRFTPADNAVGTTVVSVVAIDSEGAVSDPVLVTITITEVNDPPTAGNITFNGDENTVLPIGQQALLAVATDPDLITNPNEVLRVTAVQTTSQAGATIRVLPSGDLEYDPRGSMTLQALRPGQTLADTFTYRVIDAAGALSNIATVTINVAGINDPPTVRDDFATLNPDAPTIIRPLDNDFDVDGTIDPRTLQITLLPAFGTVQVRDDGTLVYTPFAGFRGTDTIRYTVADDLGARSEQATITIDMNEPPVAVDDLAGTLRDRAVEINVAANDFDPDGSLNLDSIEIVTPPTRGTAIVLGGGIIRYLPSSDFVGLDTFEYIIRDDRGRPSNVGQVRVQVVASELQNPSNFTDVNASGETTPLDALLILNRLSRAFREGVTGGIPVDTLLDETPRLFYDVDGNRRVEPIDALLVINDIARRNRERLGGQSEGAASGSQEQAATEVQTLAAPPISSAASTTLAAPDSLPSEAVADNGPASLAADFGQPLDELIGSLAIDLDQEQKEKRRDDHLQAIDAAWSDVFND